jgi:TDG/mug DNA glycosylase family protein
VRPADLAAYQGHPVDDLLGPDTKLLIVGINPGLWTAAVNAHFARPGNRFWPALHRAGLLDTPVDASRGMPPDAKAELIARGIGITNIVNLATARADELTREQLVDGAARLRSLVRRIHPKVVAVLGLTAYRDAFGRRRAVVGRQPEDLEGAELWVVPNPSGLNAHETVDSLAVAYRQVAAAAGIVPPEGDDDVRDMAEHAQKSRGSATPSSRERRPVT